MLHKLAANGARAVQVEFPIERSVRALGGDEIAGEKVGNGVRFTQQLDPFGALLLEVAR